MKLTVPVLRRQTSVSASTKGVLFILAAAFCFSAMSLGVREARPYFRADVLVFYRSWVQFLVLVWFWRRFFAGGLNLTSLHEKFRTHFGRGAFGIASMFFLYVALQNVPLAMANQLVMTSVFWSTLFGWWWLGERVSRAQGMAGALVLAGVVLSLQRGSGGSQNWVFSLLGIAAGLCCGFFMGMAHTTVRKMRLGLGTREIVFFFAVSGILWTLPSFVFAPQIPRDAGQWGLLVGIGLTATLGQVLMTQGFFYATAYVGTVAKLSEFALNLMLGWVWLAEVPPPGFLFGIALVLAGLIGLLRQKAP